MNSRSKFFLFSIFAAICLFVAIFSGYLGLNASSIEGYISTDPILAAIIYNLIFIGLTSISFSVTVMIGLGILLFPVWAVIIYAMIGIMGSSIIDFYLSRKLGKDYLRNYISKRGGEIEKLNKVMEENPFKTILILSAIYFVPPTIPNLLGGVIKINLRDYSIATFIGNLPNTVLTAYLINGFFYSNILQISLSITGLVLTTLISLYFYKGEFKEILHLSFPWAFRIKSP